MHLAAHGQGLPLCQIQLLQLQPQATEGIVGARGVQDAAIGQVQGGGQGGSDPVHFAHLARFSGHANGGPQHEQAVGGPNQVHHHRGSLVGVPPKQAHQAHAKGGDVEHHQDGVGQGGGPVKVGALHQPTLGRDVELAQLGVDDGQGGGQGHVPGQHRLVHLGPEGVAVFALYVGVGHPGLHDVGQHIQRQQKRMRVDDVDVEKQIRHGGRQKHQARQPKEKVQHGIAVANALPQRQPFAQQGVVGAENLCHAPRPANALADVGREAFRGQTRRLGFVDIGRGVAPAVQLEGGVRIFGHGFNGNAAHFHQWLAANYGARAAEKRGVPKIVAVLNQAVKQGPFIGHAPKGAQVALKRVGREEMVRRLQHGAFWIALKPAHGGFQERARGQVVAVKNGDQLPIGFLQGVVQVARLGVVVVRADDVLHPHFGRKRPKFLAPTIVQEIDLEAIGRPIQCHGRQHRRAHDGQRLVVSRNEHIHGGPGLGCALQRGRRTLERPRRLNKTQHHDQPGVGLGRQQAVAQNGLRQGFKLQRRRHAPPGIAAGGQQTDGRQGQRGKAPRQTPHHQGQGPGKNKKQQLAKPVERCRHHNHRRHHGQAQRQPAQAGIPHQQLHGALDPRRGFWLIYKSC